MFASVIWRRRAISGVSVWTLRPRALAGRALAGRLLLDLVGVGGRRRGRLDIVEPRQLLLRRPLGDRHVGRQPPALADDLERDARADRLARDQISERLIGGDRLAGDADHDVALLDAGPRGGPPGVTLRISSPRLRSMPSAAASASPMSCRPTPI